MPKKLQTVVVKKSGSREEERMFIDPPYTVFGSPVLPQSQSIIMKVGGLRQMLESAGLGDDDSFRIEWFNHKPTEYSFFKKPKEKK